jgi:hypothetical protein
VKPSASRAVEGQCKNRSIGTEEADTNWFKRYIYFHDSATRPRWRPGIPGLSQSPGHGCNVAASTQNHCAERSEATSSARLCYRKCFRQDTSPPGLCLTLRLQWRPGDSSLLRGTSCRQAVELANWMASGKLG